MVRQLPVLLFLSAFTPVFLIPFVLRWKRAPYLLSCAGLLLSACFSVYALVLISHGHTQHYYFGGWAAPYGIEWRLDGLSALIATLVSTVSFFVILGTSGFVQKEMRKGTVPYYMIAMLHITSLLGIVMTADLFNLFVFIEVASLTGYALIAAGGSKNGLMASYRYVILGTIGASFYLLGVGYLYAASGTLNMADMTRILTSIPPSKTVMMGLLLILLGLCIKMGLFPFHSWLPNAYTFAPDGASALIAPLSTKVMIYAFIRIFGWIIQAPVLTDYPVISSLRLLAIAAILAGSVLAFKQDRLKKMLAYSSVSQIGLMMLAFSFQNPVALTGVLLHMICHSVSKAGLFVIAATAHHRLGAETLEQFEGFAKRMPAEAFFFCMAGLSLIGIPPFGGFFSKWYMVSGALESRHFVSAAIVIFSGLLTALYIFRFLEKMFFAGGKTTPSGPREVTDFPFLISALSALGLLALGITAPLLFRWSLNHVLIN